jgi:predicted alpha/beta hydrolase family esterase
MATDDRFRDREGLSAVAGCESPSRACDVVFVHGLGGGSYSTWMGDDQQAFWPGWIGADFPTVGVWTLGYRADVSAWTSESMPLADRGTSILEELTNEGIGERPVVFVTHSMGGILVKQILRHATSFGVERWESIAARTAGIAFLATPHAGADLAGFAELARLVLRTNEQVGELKSHHSRLRELHAWFLNFQGDRKLACRTFCETRELRPGVFGFSLPKGVMVVDQTSAEPHVPGEVAIPLDDDHVSIAKPASRDAPLYKSMRRFIREALASAVSASPSQPAQVADVTGEWTADARKKGQEPFRIGLDLEVVGGRLYGTVHYPTGDAGIHDGEITGDQIRFSTRHTPQFDDALAEIRVEGRITGETLDLVFQDPSGHARATARRKSASV